MIICPEDKCTGCYACASACPKQAIKMQENKYGELHPWIDLNKCISCNLCVSVCPNNIKLTYNYPIKCYASWMTNRNHRRICASGGIGTILSEYIISKFNGVFFGSRYDTNLTPIMTFTERCEDLESFKGSRYVQSVVGYETLKNVKSFLIKGKQVLFIGTPCQISGLKGYLHREYDNLITVDLICHGCCPTKYFNDEIAYLKNKYKLKSISDIRFRGNDRNNFCLSIWSKDKRLYMRRGLEQPYFAGFLIGTSLRENCYSCQYARPERISDITIGDFIGLGEIIDFPYSAHNVSSVTLNTQKGLELYEKVLKETSSLMNIEREYSERLAYKPSLVEPFARHELNARFREIYLNKGFVYAIRKTLNHIILKNKYKRVLNYWTYIYRVPRKLYYFLLNLKK